MCARPIEFGGPYVNPRCIARSLALALPTAVLLSSCAAFMKKEDSLNQVDQLVTRIERVYVECEIANERAYEALGALQTVVAPEFEGDAALAFEQLVEAVERSEKQAKKLGSSVDPMQDTGESFFEQWTVDLDKFASMTMRKRSESRLNETRERFDNILNAVLPAREALDTFNLSLRDHLLFLGNDFNPDSLSEIVAEVDGLADHAELLSGELERCMVAARDYTQASGLPVERVASRTGSEAGEMPGDAPPPQEAADEEASDG